MAKRAQKAKARKAGAPRNVAKAKAAPAAAPAAPPAPTSRRPAPMPLMRRFGDEVDRLLEEFRTRTAALLPHWEPPWEHPEGKTSAWLPAVEMSARGGKLIVRADLPGMSKGDVKVEVRDDALCIQGERRQEKREKDKGFTRTECSYGSFYREVPLPEGIDPEQAKATFKNGVLEVTLPAPPKPEAKGMKVSIED
jgi:HSP20 family protein